MCSQARPPCRAELRAPPSPVLEALRRFAKAYEARYGVVPARSRVLHRLIACRTEAMGTHACACEECGWTGFGYNPCHDRHCPRCGSIAAAEWLEARAQRMLHVPHFQVVFTLPAELRPIATMNQRLVYDLLFQVGSSLLQDLAAQRLHARLGLTAVLHTWTSELLYHPHLHCLVTAGGLSLDDERWVPSREEYLFPGRILGKMFRGRFLEGLIDAFEDGKLLLPGNDPVAAAKAFRSMSRALSRHHDRWVVHVEPPKGRPVEDVARYLASYVKRVAIGDARIVEVTDTEVVFDSKRGTVRLDGIEFVRRFLLHVLPDGFRKVRHYGLYAPGNAKARLETARRLVPPLPEKEEPVESSEETSSEPVERSRREVCPACGERAVRWISFRSASPIRWPRGPP